jgi:hypothetical protein
LFLSFFLFLFLSLSCYMSVQPTASPFSGFTLLVHRHLIAFLAGKTIQIEKEKHTLVPQGGFRLMIPMFAW